MTRDDRRKDSSTAITGAAMLRQTLETALRENPNVFIMGEDIGVYGGAFGITRGLLDQFGPERIIETPISENSVVGMAVGAALGGCRPIVEIMFADFVTLAMDPLVNQAAKLRYVLGRQAACPMVIRLVGGAGRSYGPTHSQSFEAWFTHVPGLKVVAPSSVADHAALLRAAIEDPGPVIFLEHKRLYTLREPVSRPPARLPLGVARRVCSGDDVTIVAWSWMAVEAQQAAARLGQRGVHVDLIDPRSLKPIDIETLAESVRRTGRVLIVDETPRTAGVAAEIACRLTEAAHEYLEMPVRRLTAPDIPIPASPVMERLALPDSAAIERVVLEMLEMPQ